MVSSTQLAASAGAEAAVEVLQRPTDARAHQELGARLAALHLSSAPYFGIALSCTGGAAQLCSGNLIRQGAHASLVAGPTLAASCMRDKRSKFLRLEGPTRCATGRSMPAAHYLSRRRRRHYLTSGPGPPMCF